MQKQLRMLPLQGLLEQPELEVLDRIEAAARSKLLGDDDDDDYSGPRGYYGWEDGPMVEQISAMEEHLKSVVERLRIDNDSMKLFVKAYPKWKENRKKCIISLKKIAKSLDKDRFIFNVAKLTGFCLSIAGGAALIASVPLESNALAIAGGSATVAGGATVLGTSVTETVRIVRKVKKAKRLIKRDQVYFLSIGDWLNRASELQEALLNVLDTDILKGIAERAKKIVGKAMKIKSDHKRLKFIEKSVKGIIDTPELHNTDVPVAGIVTSIRVFATVVLLLCKTDIRFLFDFVCVSCKSLTVVVSLMETSVDAFSLAAFGSAALARIAASVIGMALDAVGIVKISLDIHRKSRSPEAKKITEAVMQLSEEADLLENVYERFSSQ